MKIASSRSEFFNDFFFMRNILPVFGDEQVVSKQLGSRYKGTGVCPTCGGTGVIEIGGEGG